MSGNMEAVTGELIYLAVQYASDTCNAFNCSIFLIFEGWSAEHFLNRDFSVHLHSRLTASHFFAERSFYAK